MAKEDAKYSMDTIQNVAKEIVKQGFFRQQDRLEETSKEIRAFTETSMIDSEWIGKATLTSLRLMSVIAETMNLRMMKDNVSLEELIPQELIREAKTHIKDGELLYESEE